MGAQPIQPKAIAAVKELQLTTIQIHWDVEASVNRTAFAHNGHVRGPTIRVTDGDRVRVVAKN